MPRLKNKTFGTFNDGLLDICEVDDRKIVKTICHDIRFGDRVVGIERFWKVKVNSSVVDKTVAIPWGVEVNTLNMVIIKDKQYKVLQVQKKFDATPPESFLTLEENKALFADLREVDNEKNKN